MYISRISTQVILSRLTITHGYAVRGAGVFNVATLTVKFSIPRGNIAKGVGLEGGGRGGLYNTGTVTISDSTVSGNKPLGGFV